MNLYRRIFIFALALSIQSTAFAAPLTLSLPVLGRDIPAGISSAELMMILHPLPVDTEKTAGQPFTLYCDLDTVEHPGIFMFTFEKDRLREIALYPYQSVDQTYDIWFRAHVARLNEPRYELGRDSTFGDSAFTWKSAATEWIQVSHWDPIDETALFNYRIRFLKPDVGSTELKPVNFERPSLPALRLPGLTADVRKGMSAVQLTQALSPVELRTMEPYEGQLLLNAQIVTDSLVYDLTFSLLGDSLEGITISEDTDELESWFRSVVRILPPERISYEKRQGTWSSEESWMAPDAHLLLSVNESSSMGYAHTFYTYSILFPQTQER